MWDRHQKRWIAEHAGELRVIDLDGSLFGRLNNGRYRFVSSKGDVSEFAPRGCEYFALDGRRTFCVWDRKKKDLEVLSHDEIPWE